MLNVFSFKFVYDKEIQCTHLKSLRYVQTYLTNKNFYIFGSNKIIFKFLNVIISNNYNIHTQIIYLYVQKQQKEHVQFEN